VALEPGDRVAGAKMVEGAEEGFFAARIVFCERFGLEAVMSDVAAPTSGDFNLLQHLAPFFEEEYLFARVGGFCCSDCGEVSSCAAADYDEVLAFGDEGSHGRNGRQFPVRSLKIRQMWTKHLSLL